MEPVTPALNANAAEFVPRTSEVNRIGGDTQTPNGVPGNLNPNAGSGTKTAVVEPAQVTEHRHFKSQEQRVTMVDDSRIMPGEKDYSIMGYNQYSMPENSYTVKNLMQNSVQVAEIQWNLTDTADTMIYVMDYPAIIAKLSSFQQEQLRVFSYFKAFGEFTFKLSATPFHQGTLMAWYDPMAQCRIETFTGAPIQPMYHKDAGDVWKEASTVHGSGCPNIQLDAATSNSGKLITPFEHLQTYLTTNSTDHLPVLGRVFLQVLNPLLCGPGATQSVTVQIFFNCTATELHVPVPPHDPSISSAFFGNVGADDKKYHERRERMRIFNEKEAKFLAEMDILTKAAGGMLGQVLGKEGGEMASSAIGIASDVATGNFSGAASKGIGFLSDALKTFNLDYPTEVHPWGGQAMHNVAPYAHMRGCNQSIRLAAGPTGGYLKNTEFSSGPQTEMNVTNIVRNKMLVYRASTGLPKGSQKAGPNPWTTTMNPGTVLVSMPVYPTYSMLERVNNPAGLTYALKSKDTYLSYMSKFFTQWRGGMSYKIDFVSTMFHSGKVAAIFVPNSKGYLPAVATPPTSRTDWSQYPLYMMDLKESKEFTFTVPYVSSIARKMVVPASWAQLDFIPSDDNPGFSDKHITGWLHFVVFNKLVAPSAVVNQVDLNIYQGGASDIELVAPCGMVCAFTGRVPELRPVIPPVEEMKQEREEAFEKVEIAEAQMNYQGTDLDQQAKRRNAQIQHSVAPPNATKLRGNFDEGVFLNIGPNLVRTEDAHNELVTDVRDLARRMGRIATRNVPIVPDNSYIKGVVASKRYLGAGVAVARDQFAVNPFTADAIFGFSEDSRLTGLCGFACMMEGVSRLYALWHGSLRYTIEPYCTRATNGKLVITYIPNMGEFQSRPEPTGAENLGSVSYENGLFSGYPQMSVNLPQQSSVMVETPFYSPHTQIVTDTQQAGGADPTERSAGYLSITMESTDMTTWPMYKFAYTPTEMRSFAYALYMGGGDDLYFSYLTPPGVTYTSVILSTRQ